MNEAVIPGRRHEAAQSEADGDEPENPEVGGRDSGFALYAPRNDVNPRF
jgi:hypothetical protein